MPEEFGADEIVTAIYRALLLREPDAEGLAMATAHLRATHALEPILRGVFESAEFKERLPLFLSFYQPEQRLGEPDPSGSVEHPFTDPAVLDAHIRAHPALSAELLSSLGEPVEKLTNPAVFRCSRPSDRIELNRRGIRVHEISSSGELLVVLDESAKPFSLEVRTQGHGGNMIVLGADCAVHGEVQFGGRDNLIYLGGRAFHPQTYKVAVYTHNCVFIFGRQSSSVGSSFHVEGPSHHLIVGHDCMFAADVYVACTDNHALVEAGTGEVLNLGGNLTIGPHAWLGFGSTVLKGAHIGKDAVIASRSVLTTACLPNTLMVGSPARCLRDNINWDRDFPSAVDARRRLKDTPS